VVRWRFNGFFKHIFVRHGVTITPRRAAEGISSCFVVKASDERPLIFIYYGEGVERRSLARLLTRNAARRIAVVIAKVPDLLQKL
jgi:hypothetical protein